MNIFSTTSSLPFFHANQTRADHVGVIASVLCAIHCAATPFLLILTPTVGRLWSHPASHWIAAAWVVPLASIMVWRGFLRHRKRWIVFTGLVGMSLVIVGATLPIFNENIDEGTVCEIDTCCPSIVQDTEGRSRLHIPTSATVTTLGGLALVVTHLGNLCACRGCRICKHRNTDAV